MNGWRALIIGAVIGAGGTGCHRAETDPAPPRPSGPVEEREGRWYATGTSNLYSGTLTHQYPSGTNSVKNVYTNGLKLSQRAWHTNGLLKSEFVFHQGQLALRRSWDATGKPLNWNHQRLAEIQLQRGLDLVAKSEWVAGYVWIHLAATNGHPVALQALVPVPASSGSSS